MPKLPPAPKTVKYTPHSYTYWANRFASPVDLALSSAAASVSAPKQLGVPQNVLDTYSQNDKFNAQFKSLSDYMAGNKTSMEGIKASDLNPQVAALYKQVQTLEQKAQTEQNDMGPLGKIFDILSRPMMAIASAYQATIREEQANNKSTDINDAAYIPLVGTQFYNAFTHGGDLWAGLSGQNKADWIQILNQAHPDMNNIAKGVLGFSLDVAMDPLSYVGVGAVKTVTKGAFKAAELVGGDASKISDNIAKEFAQSPGLAETVKERLLVEFEGQYSAHATALQYADLTSKEAIQNILVGGVGKDKVGTRGAVLSNLQNRASQQRVVTTFLSATADALKGSIRARHFDELVMAAYKDGTLVKLDTLNPKVGLTYLTPKALSMPEAELVSQYKELLSQRGVLSSRLSVAKVRLAPDEIKSLNEQIGAINSKLDELVGTTPLDMKDPTVIKAITEVGNKNPEFVSLTNDLKRIRSKMKKWIETNGKTTDAPTHIHTQEDLTAYLKSHPESISGGKRYSDLMKARDAAEARRSQILAEHLVEYTNDVVLPEGARRAKFKKIKKWQTLASKYVEHYNAAMTAQKGADVTATAAMDAGDLAKAVEAKKGLDALGPTSVKVDSTLKALAAELQARLHGGQMTHEELGLFLKSNGITDPSVLHDLANLTPEVSKVLHAGGAVPPEVSKIMTADNVTLDAIHSANDAVLKDLKIKAIEHAEKVTPEILKTAEDLMVRSMDIKSRKAFALRVGFMGNGPQVAALAVPEMVSRLVEAAYKAPVVGTGIKAFNKALVSSAGLDSDLNRIRAREAGRTTEVIARNGERIKVVMQQFTPAERATAWDEMLDSSKFIYQTPEAVAAIRQELYLIAEKFGDNYFPNMHDPLSIHEVNQWIPGRYKMRDRQIKGWRLDAAKPLTMEDDPVTWLVNSLRSSPIKDMDPAQVIWDLQIATEKAIARKATIETIVQQFGIPTTKFDKTEDFMATHLSNKYGYRDHKLGKDEFIFEPETAKQLDKIEELFSSPRTLEVFGEYAGKITQLWKRSVTIYNPGFHSRNTFGDIFVSWLDGVQGVHGVQSHGMAIRTIKKFRNLTDPNDPMIRAMGQPEMLDTYRGVPRQYRPESHNVVLFKKNGHDYTMGEIYAAYVNEGLLSGYTNTEFSAVFRSPGHIGSTAVGKKATGINQGVMHISEAREDVMRLAHFIDVIRKSPADDIMVAASDAGARVRKFHFDYSDFTMTEKMLFARVFPFYKWTRKAFPLMVESLFAKPGKMSLYPKATNAIAAGVGYDSTNPDIVTPDWINSRMLTPIGGSEDPTGGGATRYAGISLPYDALRAVGSPGESIIGMLHPGLKAGLEFAQGKKLGDSGGQIDPKQYALGMFPQSNFASKQMNGTGTQEQLMSFLTGVTFTQNNQKTIQAELLNRKEAAVRAQPPKPTKPII